MQKRRHFLATAAALVALLAARVGDAEDVAVPVALQAELLVKVAAYDRSFPARAGDRARVAVLHKTGSADSAHVAAQMISALDAIPFIAGLPRDTLDVTWAGGPALAALCKSKRVAIVYVTPGFVDDVASIRAALDGVDVLTVSAMPAYVPAGVVLGFDLVSGKTKLLVHLGQAKKQNVAFKAEALKLMKVYE